MVLVFTPDRKHLEIYQYQYQRLWTIEHVNMVIFSQVDFQKWKDEDDSDNEEQVQCVCADGFHSLPKAFHYPVQLLSFCLLL
jgi:hypothetical protein